MAVLSGCVRVIDWLISLLGWLLLYVEVTNACGHCSFIAQNSRISQF